MFSGNRLKSAHFVVWVTKERYNNSYTLIFLHLYLAVNPVKPR